MTSDRPCAGQALSDAARTRGASGVLDLGSALPRQELDSGSCPPRRVLGSGSCAPRRWLDSESGPLRPVPDPGLDPSRRVLAVRSAPCGGEAGTDTAAPRDAVGVGSPLPGRALRPANLPGFRSDTRALADVSRAAHVHVRCSEDAQPDPACEGVSFLTLRAAVGGV